MFEDKFYIRDVCPNSCLKVGLASRDNFYQSTARQDRDISDDKFNRLLHVKGDLERARCVARVTRQEVNEVSGVKFRRQGTSDDKMV